MAAVRQLSQAEIDVVFANLQARNGKADQGTKAVPLDFRRSDRIEKAQLRAIHLLHDTFVPNLASSLSAYLLSYLIVDLVSVEQLSYAEFLESLPYPTCVASLGLKTPTKSDFSKNCVHKTSGTTPRPRSKY